MLLSRFAQSYRRQWLKAKNQHVENFQFQEFRENKPLFSLILENWAAGWLQFAVRGHLIDEMCDFAVFI